MIIHIIGYIKVNAANGIHNLSNGFPFDYHLIIRLESYQLSDFFIQRLNSIFSAAIHIIHGVDLLDIPGNIHHGVSGNRHDRRFLIGHIIACQQHGVGIAAASGIPAQHKNRIKILALALTVCPGTNTITIVDLFRFRSASAVSLINVRPDKQILICNDRYQRNCQTDQNSQ